MFEKKDVPEEQPEVRQENAPAKKQAMAIVAIVVAVIAAVGGGAYWYVNYQTRFQLPLNSFEVNKGNGLYGRRWYNIRAFGDCTYNQRYQLL